MEIERKNLEDILGLTPTQEGLLFHYLENPMSDDYFEQLCLQMNGTVSIEDFDAAWQHVVDNNEMLRTVFRWENTSQPVQIVQKEYKPEITYLDFTEIPSDKQFQMLEETKKKDREKKFDLHAVPFRIHLCKLGDDYYEMIITNHHIIYDGWSNGILLKDFINAYHALYERKKINKETKVKFKEYIKELKNNNKRKQELFWKDYLNGLDTITEIPIMEQKLKNSHKKENYCITLSQEELRSFTKNQNLTLASFIFSVWGILLQKYNNCKDVVFGTPVSGRNVDLIGINNVIGNFINTVPLRIKSSSTESALELMKKVNSELHEREEYELTSLVDIVQYSGFHTKNGLFDSILVMDEYPIDDSLLQKDKVLYIENYKISESTSYDLTISIKFTTEMVVNFNYNTNLYTAKMIKRMADHFHTIVSKVLAEPATLLGDIDILSDKEKNEIFLSFNGNEVQLPQDKCVHELFEHQVKQHPEKVAVKYNDETLTYKQLDEQSNQLGNLHLEKGLEKEQLVAILLDRSPIMLTSILGTWKAGGAYVPLNPEDPSMRICNILEDAKPAILITSERFLNEEIKLSFQGQIILIDQEKDLIERQSTKHLPVNVTWQDLAYVIYTSGSTGNPKGVMIEHLGMLNHMIAKQKLLNVSEASVVSQNSSHTFDISVWQFFLSLISGGTTVIYPNELLLEPEKFMASLEKDNVTILQVVPSYLSTLLETVEQPPNLSHLEHLLVTGEDVKPKYVNSWFDKYPLTKVINAYGPTEASDDITHFVMDGIIESSRVPIGYPVPNLNVYIVDEDMNLCSVGVKGEICVSGIGVGRGYINNPEKTHQVFQLDPFIGEENIRFYKTGDIGRFLEDGTIEYFGRKDFQIKIRGFRIELGEVENQLLSFSGIKEAVVLDWDDENGEKSLAAYVTTNQPIDQKTVRSYLAERMPEYMVPHYITILEELPLSTNGKINKKALPKPEAISDKVKFYSIDKLKDNMKGNVIGDTTIHNVQEIKKKLDYHQIFDCFIMGESTLAISCAELLLEHGQRIIGMATEDKQVTEWAISKNIPTMRINNKEYEQFIEDKCFDYLFSIYNVAILPKKILQLPNKAVINFHDSFLPKYAGLYVPSWAIINQEKEYGVSWHLMDEGIDTGDLLIQEKFSIDEDETAYSLHLKCYEVALRTFKQLIGNIGELRERSYEQEQSQRSYFSKYQRPENACVISFEWTAEKIKGLFNGLDLNASVLENNLGLPKIKICSNYYVLENMMVLSSSSRAKPGTIINLQEGYIDVSTGSKDIRIHSLMSFEGHRVNIKKIFEKYSLEVGSQINDNQVSGLSNYYERLARHEDYWVSKLGTYDYLLLDHTVFQNESLKEKNESNFKEKEIKLTSIVPTLDNYNKDEQILAWIVLYLSLFTNQQSFSIDYNDQKIAEELETVGNLYSHFVPLRVKMQNSGTIFGELRYILEEVREVQRNKTYSKDVHLRYPSLKIMDLMTNEMKVTAILAKDIKKTMKQIEKDNKKLSFIISEDEDLLTIVYDENLVDEINIDHFANGFHSFVKLAIEETNKKVPSKKDFLNDLEIVSVCRSFTQLGHTVINLSKLTEVLLEDEKIKQVYLKPKALSSGDKVLYVFALSDEQLNQGTLSFLTKEFDDEQQIPIELIQLDKFPVTHDGKIDEVQMDLVISQLLEDDTLEPEDDLERLVLKVWMDTLGREKIGINDNFFDIGGNSLLIIRLVSKLKKLVDLDIPVTILFKYPTVTSLTEFIKGKKLDKGTASPDEVQKEIEPIQGKEKLQEANEDNSDIAIVGLACRFPGARNAEEFWGNLVNGKESMTFFTEEELIESGIDSEIVNQPNYVKSKGVVEDIEYFDASFFGYSPKEAKVMDPQFRFLHECTWEALENAGYSSEDSEKNIGLFVGSTNNFFWLSQIFNQVDGSISQFETNLLNDRDFLASRVSYKLNLTGPSMTLQTACSTSLVAVDAAVQNIQSGKCKMAIAGGVSITYPNKIGYFYQEGMVNSPDGHCRAFDEEAAGTFQGTGVGLVVLKRLEDAIMDGDQIYAVIKGSATNNDGASKVGYTAPSIDGQVKVIKDAQRKSNVDPESISYVEAHGTGTILGDPIEIEALTEAFNSRRKNYCAIGSVKTNIGHLDVAAGIAGIIKTVLSLKNKMIPPSLNYIKPNPKIDFSNSPFYVNTELKKWDSPNRLRAAVSSFGIGGTNAHVILEEAPLIEQKKETHQFTNLLLSARTPSNLDTMSENLLNCLKTNPNLNLSDVTYTLNIGRKDFAYRKVLTCRTTEDAISLLSEREENQRGILTNKVEDETHRVIFMFSGLGSQYVHMGRELYRSEPFFRKELERCFNILKGKEGNTDFYEVLYPNNEDESSKQKLQNMEFTQPIIFSFEYALAKLMMHWGVKPTVMIGYSFGEYVAACIAGVFTLEDALDIILTRSKLIQSLPQGSMLSVPLEKEKVIPYLTDQVSIAIDNGSSCVISGPTEEVNQVDINLRTHKVLCMPVNTTHAVHSPMMKTINKDFVDKLNSIQLNVPKIPYISNVTGTWITNKQATDPSYWVEHLVKTVEFAKGVQTLMSYDSSIFVEIGPGNDLGQLIQRFIENENENHNHNVLNLVRPLHQKVSDITYLFEKLSRLWIHGIKINWKNVYGDKKGQLLSLPTYPFEKEYHWIDMNSNNRIVDNNSKWFFGKNENVDDWYYVPSWKRSFTSDISESQAQQINRWIVFSNHHRTMNHVVEELRKQHQQVIVVKEADEFYKKNDLEYSINPKNKEDYEILVSELKKSGDFPNGILHGFLISEEESGISRDVLKHQLDLGFYSLINLAQAIGNAGIVDDILITVLTNNMHDVVGGELSSPGKSTVLGPVKIIPLEYHNIKCKNIDIILATNEGGEEDRLFQSLLKEIYMDHSEGNIVSLRGNYRWIPSVQKVDMIKKNKDTARLRSKGVYFITGGLGGMGLYMAEYLSKTVQANLVLVGRSNFPQREEWESYKNMPNADPTIVSKIERLLAMERNGSTLMIVRADISNEEEIKQIHKQVIQRFGKVHGVIHTAGVAEYDGIIQNKKKENIEKIFMPKLYGTLVLEKMFEELDFICICSSMAPVIYYTKVGQVAYCSANEFIDSFVNYKKLVGQTPIFGINWSDWKEVGMSVESAKHWGEKLKISNSEDIILEDGILPSEGIEIFKTVLENNYSQVLVSPENLAEKIRTYETTGIYTLQEILEESTKFTESVNRPSLSTEYVSPEIELEIVLTDIWSNIFGFKEIGIHDDFFELGGDSLKALNTISKVHQQLDIKVSLTDFYEHPTIYNLTRLISMVEEEEFTQYSNINVAEKKDYYELSSTQLRMYILNQIEPESTNYNMTFAWTIDGYIDKERLQNSFEKVITRHESLKTSFELKDNKPCQKIHKKIDFKLAFNKVEEENVDQFINEFNTPFNLGEAPLFRVGLLEISKEKRTFIINIHHIISDGLSNNILMRDLISFYNSEELASLLVQYKDYSEWHHDQKQTAQYKASENYWLDIYKGQLPKLVLPYDYERTIETSFDGDIVNVTLDSEILRRLKNVATKNDTTLYTLLLSIFNILLSKLSCQEDIIIGCPVAGREHADLENVVGMFVNTLALRNSPQGQLTFTEFLKQTHTNTVKAFEHQEYQFNDLVNNLELERDISRNPLFDVIFNYQEGVSQLEFNNFTCTPYYNHSNESQFDLSLDVLEIEEELQLAFEFRLKLFEKESIQRFAKYFQNIIFSVLRDDKVMIKEIEILAEKEKELLVNVINDTSAYFPKEKTIICLFEEQVQKTPSARALCYQGENITYQELNERVNSLAKKLRDIGIGANKLVGILAEPSIEMVVGILAILKAGAAYVPIDTEAPVNRSAFILNDVQAEVLLTVESLSKLADEISCDVTLNYIFYLDRTEQFEGDTSNLQSKPSPEDLIYTIYTSGTTGNPKGVMVTHRNINNFTYFMKNEFHMGVGFNTLLLTKYFFDPSAADMFSTLTSGGTLHLVDKNVLLNKTELRRYIKQHHIHLFDEAPSFASEILENEETLPSLKYIIVGGENVPETLVKNLLDLNYTVYIFYGATEVTVDSHFYKSTKEKPVYIGRPIANVKAYILDRYHNLVPPGVEGEICISGEGISNGYINNKQLTAEKFIQSPFNEGLMYKTGDIGIINKDYLFEFKGRKDNQVQVNGIRVELEGIERILDKHPKINQVVVVCKQSQGRSSYLCVYFTSTSKLGSSEIRSYLSEYLPQNILPSHYVQVDHFNKMPNGKIDRKILPEVELEVSTVESFQASDDHEKFLCECWEKVLQTNLFSTTDNFFHIGGTSLLIIRLKSLIEVKYPFIQIVDLFMYPTIESLAQSIKNNEKGSKGPIIVKNAGVKIPLEFLSVDHEENHEALSYDIDISEVVEKALRQTSKNLKIAKEDIFLGIYLYLLSEYSGFGQLNVQTMLLQKDTIDSTFFDISTSKTKEDLFILANVQKSVDEISYKVSELGLVQFNTLSDSIVPFIFHDDLHDEPYRFVNVFDIVIQISEANDVTTLGFEFNEAKINEEMARKFIDLYVSILSQLVEIEVTQVE